MRLLGTELIPQLSEGEFFFEVKLPEGASLAATDRTVAGHGKGRRPANRPWTATTPPWAAAWSPAACR